MDADIESCIRNAGDASAQIALGDEAEKHENHQAARGWFASAARAGRADALRRLAANLLVHPPLAVPDGIAMARQAAELGDVEAIHLCAALAANDSDLKERWTIAFDYLLRAAEGGHELAREELRLLSGTDGENWRAMRNAIDVKQWLPVPQPHILSDSPAIRSFNRFLPPEFCDWIIGRAQGRTRPATVYDPKHGGAGRMENMRTNGHLGFSIADCDVVMMLIRARIAEASSIAPHGHEWPMALHYRTGEEYRPHFDFFDVSSPALAADVARAGQRIATFLIYLNEDFDGGETDFPRLNIRYRGKRGDALLFRSVENGKPDARTLHAGLPPTRGEKWLYSQWIREPRT